MEPKLTAQNHFLGVICHKIYIHLCQFHTFQLKCYIQLYLPIRLIFSFPFLSYFVSSSLFSLSFPHCGMAASFWGWFWGVGLLFVGYFWIFCGVLLSDVSDPFRHQSWGWFNFHCFWTICNVTFNIMPNFFPETYRASKIVIMEKKEAQCIFEFRYVEDCKKKQETLPRKQARK